MQLALIMSLLRLDFILYSNNPEINRRNELIQNTTNDYIHTKDLDHILLNYERQLFEDLNSLGRYNPSRPHALQNISAYLLNVERDIAQSTQDSSQESSQEENAEALDLGYVEEEVVDFLHTPNNPLLMGDPFFRSDDPEIQESVKLEKFGDDRDSLLNDTSSDLLVSFGEGTLFDEEPAFSNVVVPKFEEDVPDNIFSESLNLDEIAGSLAGELTQEVSLIFLLFRKIFFKGLILIYRKGGYFSAPC